MGFWAPQGEGGGDPMAAEASGSVDFTPTRPPTELKGLEELVSTTVLCAYKKKKSGVRNNLLAVAGVTGNRRSEEEEEEEEDTQVALRRPGFTVG